MDSDKQIKPWTKWSPWYVRRKIMEGSSCSRIFLCDSSPRWRQGSFATQLKAQLCSCIPAHFYFPCRLQFPQLHALTWTRHMRNVWYINSQAAESLAKWGSTWGSAAARKPQRGRWKKPGPPPHHHPAGSSATWLLPSAVMWSLLQRESTESIPQIQMGCEDAQM